MAAKVLKVSLKGEDWTFTKKFLIYDELILDEEAEEVRACIIDAKECLKITPDDAEVKCSLVIR